MAAPTAQNHPNAHSSTPTGAGARPQNYSICNCNTPPSETYLQPIIGCVNSKCRPRYYHLRCVGFFHYPQNDMTWLCPSCAPDFSQPQVAAPYHEATLLDHVNGTSASQVETAGGISPVTSPRKRKSEDYTDSSSRNKAKTSEDADSDNEEAIAESLSDSSENAHSDLPAVGASRDTPIDLAPDDDEEVSSDDGEPKSNHYCIAAFTRETGAMVKCDNDCVGEWFHWACVGLNSKPSTSRKWYCHDCRKERHDARIAERRSKKTPAKLKRRTPSPTPEPEDQSEYCTCGTPADNDMIACDGTDCEQEWFHFACVGLTAATVPEGEWYCDDCA